MKSNFVNKFVDLLIAVFGLGADVVTVTSGSAGNAGSTAAELITYMSARLLEVAEYNTILDQFGKHVAEYKICSEYREILSGIRRYTPSNYMKGQSDASRRRYDTYISRVLCGRGMHWDS